MKDTPEFRTRILRKITEVSEEQWNTAFPDVLESYDFFKSIEESDFAQFVFYYILVYNNGRIAGATPCFLMDYPFDTTLEGPLKKISNKIRKIFPKIFTAKMLIYGSPACEGRLGIAYEDKISVVRKFVEAMEEIARKEKTSILVFKDISLADSAILDGLLKEGFGKAKHYPSVEMEINFKSFDEYLKKLSRSTRKSLLRKFRQVDGQVKIDLEVTNNLDSCLDEAYNLYLQILSKSDLQFEKIPKDFFENISRNMPGEVKYFLWRIDQKLVAFEFCLVSADTLIDEYMGFDYSVAYKHHLYFITFRDIIKWCIENGIKKYQGGQLDYEPKKRLHLNFVPLYLYAKHMNVFLNQFFRFLYLFLKPENFDEHI